MRVRHLILATVSAVSLALPAKAATQAEGIAEQPVAASADTNDTAAARHVDEPKSNPPQDDVTANPVDLLPLIRVDTPSQAPGQSAIGGYVRFYVCDPSQCGGSAEPRAAPSRLYGEEHRDWLSRWLIGRSFSRLLSLKLSVSRPNISATATLASSVLQSNRSVGETWNSEINGRRYLTPFLRVDPDTVVSVDVEMNASTQVQANITRAVLGVVGRAVQLVQPTGQLITSLNSERFRQTSDFIDQSVSTLFATSLLERSSNQFAPEEWANKQLAEILARFPMNRRLMEPARYRYIGNWRLMATAPRISIFSDVEMYSDKAASAPCDGLSGLDLQGCRAFIGLTPQRVLGISVGENLNLGQALLADTAISGEVGRLLSANGTDAKTRAGSRLCGLVAAKAEALGFNRYDAAAAVWAFSHDVQLEENRTHLMGASSTSIPRACSAATLATALKLD
jgi:hypothetical protein